MYATDFADSAIAALEEKRTLRQAYGTTITNSRLATL
jgi:glutathione synthase